MAKSKSAGAGRASKAKSRTKKSRGRKTKTEAAGIQRWATDPMDALPPMPAPVPDLPGGRLGTRIVDPALAPPPQVYVTGTAGFRYWTAADALRRSAEVWADVGTAAWNAAIGSDLPVRLDDGVDLNAYYARTAYPPQDIKQGLSFFHDTVRDLLTGQNVTVYSGESPDVVAHELGHAVLDALKPGLWGVATTEAAAFHESFGDVSAILTALQLPVVRQAVLEETQGRLSRSSSISRVAEQLGYAIRQRRLTAVDADSLRNAANLFVYADPTTLPADGPATTLTRAPHNFSRVFTAAFLDALGGMVLALEDEPTADGILQASQDMAALLAGRAGGGDPYPLLPVGGGAARARGQRALPGPLRRGPHQRARAARAAADPVARRDPGGFHRHHGGGGGRRGSIRRRLRHRYRTGRGGGTAGPRCPGRAVAGVAGTYAEAPAVDDSPPPVAPLGIAASDPAAPGRSLAVQLFVEELIVRGRLNVGAKVTRGAALMNAVARRRLTHHLVRVGDAVELHRLTFECGH